MSRFDPFKNTERPDNPYEGLHPNFQAFLKNIEGNFIITDIIPLDTENEFEDSDSAIIKTEGNLEGRHIEIFYVIGDDALDVSFKDTKRGEEDEVDLWKDRRFTDLTNQDIQIKFRNFLLGNKDD